MVSTTLFRHEHGLGLTSKRELEFLQCRGDNTQHQLKTSENLMDRSKKKKIDLAPIASITW